MNNKEYKEQKLLTDASEIIKIIKKRFAEAQEEARQINPNLILGLSQFNEGGFCC